MTDDCPVCGQEASRHSHYGVRVCHSCRTFFRSDKDEIMLVKLIQNLIIGRRTFELLEKKKMRRSFFCCLRGGDCQIDVETRKKCNFCRWGLERKKERKYISRFLDLKNVKMLE